MPIRFPSTSLALAVALLAASPMARAQQSEPLAAGASAGVDKTVHAGDLAVTEADRSHQVQAVGTTEPPRIDGHLDEAVWETAPLLTGFLQSQPDEGGAATERTQVRVLFDEDAIYVSAMMYDSEPEQVVATVLRRDESHDANDAFAVTLDTYHDHRNGYYFETNALGAKFDAQIIGEGGTTGFGGGQTFNRDWDAVWEAAGQRTAEGWSVEIAIPFWALRFDRAAMQVWGINFRRTIRRKTEQVFWAPIPRQFDVTRLSLAGILVGMQRVARPKNMQVKPFMRGDVGQFPAGPVNDPFGSHNTSTAGEVGLDAKWAITPNMTLDATVNTDFAQVEADDVQINLTRFPLFFPEKREFFLENAGLFQFGSGGRGSPRVLGFHSRDIGIGNGGEVPIVAGARLTGKAGAWNLGALNIQTRSVDDRGLPSENHSVLRVRRELGSRSSIGAMFTNRQANGDQYNREIGFDGRWALSESTTIDGWWMKTSSPGSNGESDWAGAVSAQWANPTWRIDGAVMQVGDGFDPQLGFVNRRDIRSYSSTTMWTPFYADSPTLRNMTPHVSLNYVTDRDSRLLSRRWHYDWDVFLKRGDKLSVAHNRMFEHIDVPFEIVPGVFVPAGTYHFDELNIELVSDQSRPVWASINYTWGGFWDGDRKNWRLSSGFHTGPRFNAEVSLDRNDVDLGGGSFVTDLWRLRLAYDFNTKLFLSGLFQYDDLTDQFQSNVRLNYIHSPGSDVFLVYNERRLAEDPTLIDRAIILKVTRLLRL